MLLSLTVFASSVNVAFITRSSVEEAATDRIESYDLSPSYIFNHISFHLVSLTLVLARFFCRYNMTGQHILGAYPVPHDQTRPVVIVNQGAFKVRSTSQTAGIHILFMQFRLRTGRVAHWTQLSYIILP